MKCSAQSRFHLIWKCLKICEYCQFRTIEIEQKCFTDFDWQSFHPNDQWEKVRICRTCPFRFYCTLRTCRYIFSPCFDGLSFFLYLFSFASFYNCTNQSILDTGYFIKILFVIGSAQIRLSFPRLEEKGRTSTQNSEFYRFARVFANRNCEKLLRRIECQNEVASRTFVQCSFATTPFSNGFECNSPCIVCLRIPTQLPIDTSIFIDCTEIIN